MFRKATWGDCELVWRWRLEDERAPWYEGALTTWGIHEEWFGRNIERIKIWELDGTAVGMIRVESDGSLHFTFIRAASPVPMLEAATGLSVNYGDRLKAVVDQADMWRTQALVDAGFREYPVRFLAYKT